MTSRNGPAAALARWRARPPILVRLTLTTPIFLVAAALPGAILAATPTRNPLDPLQEEPPIEPAFNLLGPIVAIAVLLVIIAGVIGAGFVLARVGGRAGPASPQGGAAPSRYLARSIAGRGISLLVAVVAVAVGAEVGRDVAEAYNTGGMATIGAAVLIVFLVIVILGLTVPAFVAWMVRGRQMSPAIATLLAAGGLLAVAPFGGVASFGLGGGFHDPVSLQSLGRVQLELRGASLPFTPRVDASAECTSVADGRTIAGISALDAGELGPGTLRAGFAPMSSADRSPTIELFIDGGDLPEGSGQPFWNGALQVDELGMDGMFGQGSFEGLALVSDSKTPTATNGWPPALKGTISWTCDPWP